MRLRMLLIVMLMGAAGLGGCSVLLSEGCRGDTEVCPAYAYEGRADFETGTGDWGRPTGEVTVEGHTYAEYARRVHAPQRLWDSSRYVYADVLTLGFAEVVTTPIELARLAGVRDYTVWKRVEWNERGGLVAWMNGEVVGGAVRWGPRETEIPRYSRLPRRAE